MLLHGPRSKPSEHFWQQQTLASASQCLHSLQVHCGACDVFFASDGLRVHMYKPHTWEKVADDG
jgi:hypothetical protein